MAGRVGQVRDDVPVSSTRHTAATIAAQREASRRLALTKRMREAEEAILARAPEHDLQPSLDRIQAVMELLGDPQRSFDPPDRDQRQDLDHADHRGHPARARPDDRPIHLASLAQHP
jgi:hypothetical protein